MDKNLDPESILRLGREFWSHPNDGGSYACSPECQSSQDEVNLLVQER